MYRTWAYINISVQMQFCSEFAGKVTVPGGHHHHITNGISASRGQFPWQVSIMTDNTWYCGGSVISNDWILTAAHCG
jgi:Secreted trypsin-like serine protease